MLFSNAYAFKCVDAGDVMICRIYARGTYTKYNWWTAVRNLYEHAYITLISLGKTKFVSGMLENEFTWNQPDYNYYFIPTPSCIITVFGHYIDFQFWDV